MTTVITRLYADQNAAEAVARRLRFEGFPGNAVQVISAGGMDRDALVDKMSRAMVPGEAAAGYAGKVEGGNSLLVIRATYRPLGAAQIARDTVARSPALDSGVTPEESWVKDGPDHAPSVLKDHPRLMTLPIEPEDYRPGLISEQLGIPLLSRPKARTSAIRGGRHVSKAFWPMPLVTRNRKANSAMHGTRHMSKAFWPMPLLSKTPRRNSVIRGGALPLSRALGWPTISSR